MPSVLAHLSNRIPRLSGGLGDGRAGQEQAGGKGREDPQGDAQGGAPEAAGGDYAYRNGQSLTDAVAAASL